MPVSRGFAGLAAVALLMAAATPAQSQVRVGVVGGISHFTVDQEDEIPGVELSHRTGLAIGALVELGLTEQVSVQAEALYLHKGSDASIDGFGDVEVQATYIEVPVMAKLAFDAGTSFVPYLLAGPTVGFLLEATQEADFIPESQEDITDRSEDIEFGLTGGAGVELPLDRMTLLLQGRYYHGLTDTHAEEEVHKSRGWKLVAGLTIPIGR